MMIYGNLSLFTAAGLLMENVIYRTTCKNLYLFKKTLVETGQSVMASTVPVKLYDRNAASLEQPPVEVLQELEAVPEYYTKKLVRTTHERYKGGTAFHT